MNRDDTSVEELLQQARVAAEHGDHRQALHLFSRAAREGERCADAHFGLGAVFYRMGDPLRAAEAWREALRLDPTHAKARRWLDAVDPILEETRRKRAVRDGMRAASTPVRADRIARRTPSTDDDTLDVFALSRGPAPAWRRLAALLVDVLLVALAAVMLALPIAAWRQDKPVDALSDLFTRDWAWLAAGLFVLLAAAYTVYWHDVHGRTPGKALFSLLVVGAGGEPLDTTRVQRRTAGVLLNILTLGGGYLWFLRDPDGRGLHDRLAGTRVIRIPLDAQPLRALLLATPTTLFVVAIVLSLVLVPNLINARRRADLRRVYADMHALAVALQSYRTIQQRFPDTLAGLTSPIAYLPQLPHDPFSPGGTRPYDYAVHPSQTYYILIGRGPDWEFALDAQRLVRQAVREADLIPLIEEHLYDPNHGLLSRGDIVHYGGPMVE